MAGRTGLAADLCARLALPRAHPSQQRAAPRLITARPDNPEGFLNSRPPRRRGRVAARSKEARRSGAGVQRAQPALALELDCDLVEVLELASDEELEQLYESLYGASLLSPLGKSLQAAEPAALHFRGRDSLVRLIEQRFRFLAADAGATLRGTWPTYREALLGVRRRLAVPCPPSLATADLEAEIFLFLLHEHADAVDAATTRETASAAEAAEQAAEGDGMAPPPGAAGARRPNALQRALAPLKLGAAEVVPALSKLGATLAVTNLHTGIARSLGAALVQRTVQYEAALQLAVGAGGRGLAVGMQGRAAVAAAQRGLTAAAARYAAARGVLSFVGPVMWAATLVDLARMSIGTDYARVVKVVFALAQIRLLRTRGWTRGEPPRPGAGPGAG